MTQIEMIAPSSMEASLTVNDLAKSTAWYSDIVGFTVQNRHEREGKLVAVSLQAGDVRIVLGQDDGKKGMDRVKGVGISLQLSTRQDVDAIAEGIKSRGGTFHTDPATTPWGTRAFRLRDPDGFIITVSAAR